MILKNAKVVDDHFQIRALDLRINGDRITELGPDLSGEETEDFNGHYILPGLVDTHLHGAAGIRGTDPGADLNIMTRYEATQGVTSMALTTDSSPVEELCRMMDDIAEASRSCEGTKIAAIHAEGPFINKTRKGAMNPRYIFDPDPEGLDRMIRHGRGLLRIITVAPELPGGEEFIRYAASRGLTVSMGHTDATYEEAVRGIMAGATRTTHTFNAMRPFGHRDPGVLGAAFESALVVCEMICDHVHLHPSTIRLIYSVKGADRICMVSDSGNAAGSGLTEFEEDGMMRYVRDGVVRLQDGTIAGSACTLLRGVQNLLRDGIPMGDVAKMASFNPSRSIGLEKEIGSIAVGKKADLAVLDRNLELAATFIDGKCVYKR